MERRLAAILSADVVGYSRLMGEDEVGTLVALKAHREELIDPKVAQHGGHIVKTTGDGLLIEFPSVVEAVQCAVEMQGSMVERNTDVPEARRIVFRVGINLGDVIVEGDDIYGDGVNVAARLEGLAEPGGICVSRHVRDQVRDKLPVRFEDLGEQAVKNIARPVRVFRVPTDPTAVGRAPRKAKTTVLLRRVAFAAGAIVIVAIASVAAWLQPWVPEPAFQTSPLSAKASIAVLPFANLSDDPEQEYFSDGITNDIITDLSKFSDLFVIASNSVFTYKGKPVKVQEVSRDLGVRYVLEGSVQRSGDRVRINAQLIDAAAGQHLWAERYDKDIEDIFDLQEEITTQIVGVLGVKITRLEQERAFAKPTGNLEAYDYVLRGRERLSRLTRAANFEAREMFRKVVELDPAYASAIAGLGWTYLYPVILGWTDSPSAAMERAHDLAQKAVSLDESNVYGHRLLARVYLIRRRYDLALVELERAIALNPNDADSYVDQGVALVWSSRPDGAILSLETALRFDPNMSMELSFHLGLAYYLKGRYDDAVKTLERGVGRNPDFVYNHIGLAAAYGQLDRPGEASRAAAAVRRLDPFFKVEEFGPLFRDPAQAARVAEGLRKAGLE